MNRDNDRQTSIILAVLGILPIVWLGLLIAPSVKGGLPEILPSLMNVMSDPFHIVLCEDSVKTVLVLLLCYGMGIGIYFSTRRNYRRREEHGSAKWGNAKAVDKKYRQNPPSENKLMTQAVRIGLNGKKHRRNLNTLVCGGSGAGKTRFYCKPKDFWCEHRMITFNTLTDKQEYEIVAVFRTVVYTDSPEAFKFYRFIDAESTNEFDDFIAKCKELSFYDTGVTAEYGDKLITLSTCEYSRNNSRLVVVAKRITEDGGADAAKTHAEATAEGERPN